MQLPSQECYKILQDKKGYIWFSTDNGLCRYANNKLTIFDSRNGLPEKSIYAMEEDKTGNIWFATSKNRILIFNGTQLKEAAFSKVYEKSSPSWAHSIPYALDVSDAGQIYISTYFHVARVKIKTNKVSRIKEHPSKSDLVFSKQKDHPFIRVNYKTLSYASTIELLSKGKTKQIPFSDLGMNFYTHSRILTHVSGKTDFMSLQDRLLKINPDLSYTVYRFPERILSLYTDKSGGLWVGTLNNGVFYYPDIQTMKPGHHSLSNYSVTGICEDNERGIWCSTLEKGIFYSKNKYLTSYATIAGLDRKLTLLKFCEGAIYASSSAKELFRLKAGNPEHFNLLDEKKRNFSDIHHLGNFWFLFGKELILRTDKQFSAIEQLKQKTYGAIGSSEATPNKQGRLISIISTSMFDLFERKQPELIVTRLPFINRTILHQIGDTFLLGGNQGVFAFHIKKFTYRKLKQIPEQVVKMIRTHTGRIWVITKDHGIYWMDGTKITHFDKSLSLQTAVLFDICEAPDGTIFVGSNQGIYCFKKEGESYRTNVYNTSHGLPSNEVYKVAADDKKLWFSTFEGLFNLPLSIHSVNKTSPEIHLQEIHINNRPVENPSHIIQLPYNQNNFRFTFDILTFKNGSDTQLEYRLKQDDQSTVTKLNGNEVLLEHLDPGRYQLMVFGINNDGIKSLRPEVFLITIGTPFWQTWWFMLITSFVAILFIFLIVRIIVKRIRKKEEAKTQINKLMAEYQITALQAQMNPHFIFNAINTIQGYILEKNEDEAYNYLAKFSKLIRTVLHHSQEKVLSLEHELEVLNLYIELEQLRFDHCFDYELQLSEMIEPDDIYLPGMILQPYVENAIWHGIVNLRGSRRGKLTITMERTDDLLIVSIEDNGIGRGMAMTFNQNKRHKSVGMQLTSERLKAMNQLRGYETAQVTVTDLFDEKNKPAGTQVKVRIPINQNET